MKCTDGNLLVTMAIVFGGLGEAASASSTVVGNRRRRLGSERPGGELHVVLRHRRNAERVMDEHLVVALRHAHRREDRAGRVRSHQQVDLVGGDQLLVQRAREVGLRLVVLDDPLDLPAEQPAALVQLLDVDLANDLVHETGRGERARQRQRAADADRRLRALREHAGNRGQPKTDCRESSRAAMRCSIDIECSSRYRFRIRLVLRGFGLLVIDDEIVGDRRAPEIEGVFRRMIRSRPVDTLRRRNRCRTNTRPSFATDPGRSRNSWSPARAGRRPSPSGSPVPS